jgi:hypothetical protein
MTRYFRIPHMKAPDVEQEDGTIMTGAVIGRQEIVTRNVSYYPDANEVIAVDDTDDAEQFARQYPEVIPAGELPAPPPTHARVIADEQSSQSIGDESKGTTE